MRRRPWIANLHYGVVVVAPLSLLGKYNGAQAARLGIDRKYPFALYCAAVILRAFFFKVLCPSHLSACKSTPALRIGFYRMANSP